jgi:hypothetical protein
LILAADSVQVSALETIVAKGGKVVDADVVALTEALMNELVKLDSVAAEGEAKVQRRMQVSACAEHQVFLPFLARIQRDLPELHTQL